MRPAYIPAALSLRSVRRFGAALSLRPACRFVAALSLRPACRFVAALCLALGSPPSVSAALSLALGSPLRWCTAPAPPGSPLRWGGALAPAPPGSPLRWGGALARARFAALCLRRRSRSARLAALWRRSRSRSVRRPLFRRGGFRRRQRLFVRPFGAALPLALGSPLRCFLRRPRPKAVKKIKKISDRYFIFS